MFCQLRLPNLWVGLATLVTYLSPYGPVYGCGGKCGCHKTKILSIFMYMRYPSTALWRFFKTHLTIIYNRCFAHHLHFICIHTYLLRKKIVHCAEEVVQRSHLRQKRLFLWRMYRTFDESLSVSCAPRAALSATLCARCARRTAAELIAQHFTNNKINSVTSQHFVKLKMQKCQSLKLSKELAHFM